MFDFNEIVELVIDKLEGGYYHPDMLKDGRIKDNRYSKSGETMFGIDRLTGGSINTSVPGIKFWKAIDGANARKNWSWNYRGGNLEQELKQLAGEMIKPVYEYLAKNNLTPEARKLVESDKGLYFNFVYATWNGAGWFQRFAKIINESVSSGTNKVAELREIVLNSRKNSGNSIIVQGAEKINEIFEQFPIAKKLALIPIIAIGGSLAIGGALVAWYLIKKNKNKK